MKNSVIIYFINVLILFVDIVSAEGTWTYYMDGNNINDFCLRGDYIYCATNGGLVTWNRHDKTYEQRYYFAESGCCQYQRTMFTVITVDKNGVVWCSHDEGNNIELLAFDGDYWTAYTPENSGLPERPNALMIDRDNVLWMTTKNGAASFNGTLWETYPEDGNGQGINLLLGIDKDNVKWFQTSAGISGFDGSDWKAFTMNDGLPDSTVTAMTVDSDNVKLFGFNNKTVARFDGATWTTIEGLERRPTSIAVDSDRTIWCGTSIGLYSYDGTSWEYYNYDNSDLPCNNIEALAVDTDGILWVINDSGRLITEDMSVDKPHLFRGLKRYDGTNWSTWKINGPDEYAMWCVAVDHNNVKWFGTYTRGLSKFDGENWTTYAMADTVRLSSVYEIAADNDNVLWFSYDSEHKDRINDKPEHWSVPGIMSFDGAVWTKYPEEVTGISGRSSIVVDRDNVLWFGQWNGITSYDGENWIRYDKDGFGNAVMAPVAVDHDNVKWFRASDGVSSFDGTNWTYYPDNTFKNNITKIVVDNTNSKWFLCWGGLSGYDGNDWKHYGFPENAVNVQPGHDINVADDMAVDRNNLIWCISSETNRGYQGGGLTGFDGATWTYHRDDFWLVYAGDRFAIDRDDVFWVVSHSGIVKYDKSGPTIVSNDNLPQETVRIHANYPNPSNLSTNITFTLPESGLTTLSVYNISGQKVRELVSGTMNPGTHSVTWDGRDDNCVSVSSGIYITHIKMGKHSAAGRLVLIR